MWYIIKLEQAVDITDVFCIEKVIQLSESECTLMSTDKLSVKPAKL